MLGLAGVAGGVGWAMRDRAARDEALAADQLARQTALDEAVAGILDDTGPLLEQGNWPEALAAVERADKLLAAAGRPDRPPRIPALREDLAMAERLQEIYRLPARPPDAQAPREVCAADALHSLPGPPVSPDEEFFSGLQTDAAYARAFRDYGIDLDVLEPAEAAARISRRSIRTALVNALDVWAPMRRRGRHEEDLFWKKLIEVARRADPGHWRNRCREAFLRHDLPSLEELADAVPLRRVSPTTLWQLGVALEEVGAPEKAMTLLRRAHREYPADYWIIDALGWYSWSAFHPPRVEDAWRYYSIALVLRPRSPMLHIMMARILAAKGAFEEALLENSTAWNWTRRRGRPGSGGVGPTTSTASTTRPSRITPGPSNSTRNTRRPGTTGASLTSTFTSTTRPLRITSRPSSRYRSPPCTSTTGDSPTAGSASTTRNSPTATASSDSTPNTPMPGGTGPRRSRTWVSGTGPSRTFPGPSS
jgi:tetratricopeptide (TPR) repeat protein